MRAAGLKKTGRNFKVQRGLQVSLAVAAFMVFGGGGPVPYVFTLPWWDRPAEPARHAGRDREELEAWRAAEAQTIEDVAALESGDVPVKECGQLYHRRKYVIRGADGKVSRQPEDLVDERVAIDTSVGCQLVAVFNATYKGRVACSAFYQSALTDSERAACAFWNSESEGAS